MKKNIKYKQPILILRNNTKEIYYESSRTEMSNFTK